MNCNYLKSSHNFAVCWFQRRNGFSIFVFKVPNFNCYYRTNLHWILKHSYSPRLKIKTLDEGFVVSLFFQKPWLHHWFCKRNCKNRKHLPPELHLLKERRILYSTNDLCALLLLELYCLASHRVTSFLSLSSIGLVLSCHFNTMWLTWE